MRTRTRELHEKAMAERGLFDVRVRKVITDPMDPAGKRRIRVIDESLDGDDGIVQFPIGRDLIDQARTWMGDDGRFMSESTIVRRFINEELGLSYRDAVEDFLQGQELGRIKVDRFITATGLRPLFSPIVEDGIRIGLNRVNAIWRDLIARTVPVEQTTYEYYSFTVGTAGSLNPSDAKERFGLKRVAQGAPIPVAKVQVTGKSYTLYKKGRGIEWTDESKAAPIDMAELWFEQLGVQIGWDYHDEVVGMLLNGYFVADGSDAAPVLATAAPPAMTDADLLKAYRTHQLLYGYTPTRMVMSLTRSVQILTLENGAGNRVFPNGVEAAGLPPIIVSNVVPDDKVIFVDTDFAMLQFVNKEFGTEFDRVPQTQTEGTYGTAIDLSVPFFANARLILDA